MARSPIAGGGSSISPFRGGGGSFGAFNIGTSAKQDAEASAPKANKSDQQAGADDGESAQRQAYINLQMVEADYAAGRASDGSYRAALTSYLSTMKSGTSEYINLKQRIETFDYTVERNKIVFDIEQGTKQLEDLLDYDKAHLGNTSSQEGRDRLELYQKDQRDIYARDQSEAITKYNGGHMTAAQLNEFFVSAAAKYSDNPTIVKDANDQINGLAEKLVLARDEDMYKRWQDDTLSAADFVAYATTAREKYALGTDQRKTWDDRIKQAGMESREVMLTNRFDLTQKIAKLEQAIANSGAPPTGGKGSKRIVMNEAGQWVQETTPGKGPSAKAVAAYAQHNAMVGAWKREVATLKARLAGFGGPVSGETMVAYYTQVQGQYVKGSRKWFALQDRIDSLNERIVANEVTASFRVSTGGGGGGTSSGGGGGGGAAAATAGGGTAGGASGGAAGPSYRPSNTPSKSVANFLTAYSTEASGGDHGASSLDGNRFGKYQFTKTQWTTYADRYLGDAGAPPSPDNQEEVARKLATDLYSRYKDWSIVAQKMNPGTSASFANRVSARMGIATRVFGQVNVNIGANAPRTGPVTITELTLGRSDNKRLGGSEEATRYKFDPKALVSMEQGQFEDFYQSLRSAWKNGDTVVTVQVNGRMVNYEIPTDNAARTKLMLDMDNKRIEMRKAQAFTYEGSSQNEAERRMTRWQNAVKQAGENQLTALTFTSPQDSAADRGSNPLGYGSKLVGHTDEVTGKYIKSASEDFISEQSRLAKEAIKNGDLTSAMWHLQKARSAYETYKAQTTELYNLANRDIANVVGRTNAEVPESVTADLQKLHPDRIDANLESVIKDIDETVTTLTGAPGKPETALLKVDGMGNPVVTPDGGYTLSDSQVRIFDENGNVKFEPKMNAGYDGNGNPIPDKPGYITARVNKAGLLQDGLVPAKIGVVGYLGDGRPISGRVATMLIDGKQTTIYENPFAPGKWVTLPGDQKPPTYSAPAGLQSQPVLDAAGNPTSQMRYTWEADGKEYALAWDPVMQMNNLAVKEGFGPEARWSLAAMDNQDTQGLVSKQGFGLDESTMTTDQRLKNRTGWGWFGDVSTQAVITADPGLNAAYNNSVSFLLSAARSAQNGRGFMGIVTDFVNPAKAGPPVPDSVRPKLGPPAPGAGGGLIDRTQETVLPSMAAKQGMLTLPQAYYHPPTDQIGWDAIPASEVVVPRATTPSGTPLPTIKPPGTASTKKQSTTVPGMTGVVNKATGFVTGTKPIQPPPPKGKPKPKPKPTKVGNKPVAS
jgi:hypothetical protein